MKTIVIPDVHNKIKVVDSIILKEYDADRFIFLGDFFDGRKEDSVDDARMVAKWIKKHIFDDRFVFLWGNHDIAYGFPNKTSISASYTYSKHVAIWDVLGNEEFSRWKFFTMQDGFLLTHAGLSLDFVSDMPQRLLEIHSCLMGEVDKCLFALNTRMDSHWFFRVGDARRTVPIGIPCGGILWCDADREFNPILGVSQIFGHTRQGRYPKIFYGAFNEDNWHCSECLTKKVPSANGWSVALDCSLHVYGVIENGILHFKEVKKR